MLEDEGQRADTIESTHIYSFPAGKVRHDCTLVVVTLDYNHPSKIKLSVTQNVDCLLTFALL